MKDERRYTPREFVYFCICIFCICVFLYLYICEEVGALVMKDERRYTPGGFGRRDHGGTLSLREMGGWV